MSRFARRALWMRGEAYLRHLTNVELLRLESGHFAVEDSLDVIAENMVRFYGVRVASRRALRTA